MQRESIGPGKGHLPSGGRPRQLFVAAVETSASPRRTCVVPQNAESIIGLFKTEVIKFLGPWKSVGQVEWETLKWVDWYNKTHLHSSIGYVTPNEAEEPSTQA